NELRFASCLAWPLLKDRADKGSRSRAAIAGASGPSAVNGGVWREPRREPRERPVERPVGDLRGASVRPGTTRSLFLFLSSESAGIASNRKYRRRAERL